MPEELPTPKKSLKQLEKENKRSLKKKKFEYSFINGIKLVIILRIISICNINNL